MFCFMNEKVISPNSSLSYVLPFFPEIKMEDGWSCRDPSLSDWISTEDPEQGYVKVMLRWSLLLLCHLAYPRLRPMLLMNLS